MTYLDERYRFWKQSGRISCGRNFLVWVLWNHVER